MKNWAEMLKEIEFMKPEQEDHFMQGFHRVFSRGVFTKDDAALLLGVARQAIWAKKNLS
jgi:tRNA C32,U32 (ribose-2'-O)-methylase TrmJ